MKLKKVLPVLISVLLILTACIATACGNKNSHTVEFYVDGKLYDSVIVADGGYIEDVPEVPYKENFIGEWSEKNFDEVTSDMKVFAIYTEAHYTVTFVADGVEVKKVKVRRNSHLTDIPAVPEKAGYTGKWSIADFTEINRSVTVEAIYVETPVELKFFDGDRHIYTRTMKAGSSLTDIPSVPEYEGKKLSGRWVTDVDGVKKTFDFNSVTESVNLYADYFVTVTLAGGESGKNSIECEIGEKISSVDCGSKDGYSFGGWYLNENFTERITFPYSFSENTEIYCRWFSDYGDEGFTFADGKVVGYDGDKTDITVPFRYLDEGGYTLVTAVSENAFKDNVNLKKIVLPSTVEIIEGGAFENCSSLEEISIADGNFVKFIGDRAFYGCESLTKYSFSFLTEGIGAEGFYGCVGVTEYVGLENSAVTTIAERTFFNNSALTSVALSDKVVEIGISAFEGCEKADISFPNGNAVVSVGERGFFGCGSLLKFDSENIESLGGECFAGCRSLASLSVPSYVLLANLFGTEQKAYFYEVNAGGKTVYVPQSLHSVVAISGASSDTGYGIIADKFLYDFSSVKTATVGKGIKTVGERVFGLSVVPTSSEFTVNFSNTVTEIKSYAFAGRNDMKKIVLPVSLVKIGEEAFGGLGSLKEVSVGDNAALEYVGKDSFKGTAWYEEYRGVVVLGGVALGIPEKYLNSLGKTVLTADDFNKVTVIAPYAFYGNGKIVSVTVPDNVFRIYEMAFAECTALEEFNLSPKTNVGYNEVAGEVSIYHGAILYGKSRLSALTIGVGVSTEVLFGDDVTPVAYPAEITALTLIAGESTEIPSDLYANLGFVKNLVIGEGITSVKDGAFLNCGAEKVTLPSSVEYIGYNDEKVEDITSGNGSATYIGTFGNSLKTIKIGENSRLSAIFPYAFSACGITEIEIPSSVTFIGKYAFGAETDREIVSLTFIDGKNELYIDDCAFKGIGFSAVGHKVTFPAGLRHIGKEAFMNSKNLAYVTFNDGLKTISEKAFFNSGLKNADIPSSVEYVDADGNAIINNVFGNTTITELTIRNPIETSVLFGGSVPATLAKITVYGDICDRQFYGITSLENLTIADATAIGNEAFYGCGSVTRISVPSTVESIGNHAFAECSSLMTCIFESGSVLTTIGEYLFKNDLKLRSCYFPSSITDTVWKGVFYGCASLEEISSLPSGLATIGEETFYGCDALRSVIIPAKIGKIGARAFSGCRNVVLSDAKFDYLTSIGEEAFYNCSSIYGIKAKKLVSLGARAYYGCLSADEITLTGGSVSEYSDCGNAIRTIDLSTAAAVVTAGSLEGCVALRQIMVYAENNVSEILDGLAAENIGECKIFAEETSYGKISETVKEKLAGRLFSAPTALAEATFTYDEDTRTATITSIGSFDGTVVFFPSYTYREEVLSDGKTESVRYAVTAIGENVLENNVSVKEIIVPFSVERIENKAFKNSVLTTVTFEAGSKLRSIGEDAFRSCSSLRSISLPDGVTSIEKRAFYESALTEFSTNVTSDLKEICAYAFYGCASLNSVRINNTSFERAGEYSFANSGLTSVYINENAKIKVIEAYTFAYCYKLDKSNVTLPSATTIDNLAFYQNK